LRLNACGRPFVGLSALPVTGPYRARANRRIFKKRRKKRRGKEKKAKRVRV